MSAPAGILLRTEISSICGSDLHGLRMPAAGSGTGTPPEPEAEAPGELELLGHESVGVVVESDDPGFLPGTRVLHVPIVEDGRTFAPLQRAKPGFVLAVPHGLDAERAVFGQQLGTVLWSLKHYLPTGRVPSSVFIAGGGPAGLLFAQVLRDRGAALVMVSEPVPWRRELAAALGAVAVEPGAAIERMQELTGGRGAELAVDAAGSPAARDTCLAVTAGEGVLGLFGIPHDDEAVFALDLREAFARNLTVSVVQNAQKEPGLASFAEALRMIAAGRIDVAALISHRLALDRLGEAFAVAAGILDGAVKVLVDLRTGENV
jgi:threonine dehydrogenase-like Zn-dependent dehydrogenase